MSDQVATKAELLVEIGEAWTELTHALNQLTEPKFLNPKDEAGWTVKDHIVHLTAWERSIIYLLQHRPRHEGLGVDEDLYLQGSEDEINAAIQAKTKDLPLGEVLATFFQVQEQMMGMIQTLTDEDLMQPYSHYLPDEPGEGNGPPVINSIYGNTAHHFREHLPWIEEIAKQ